MTLEAELDRPGLLVLGDTWYPGWQATVDGKETKIYPANYVMRAVVLPAGKHRVEFRYRPGSFRTGVLITLAALALGAGLLVWDRRNSRQSAGAEDASPVSVGGS